MPRGKPSPKLAITVDPDVHARVLDAATEEGVSVSAWMTDAARRALLVRDGLAAVAEWETEHGTFSDEEMAAARQRVKVRLVRGNMKDLSVFKDASFDVVWHCHSLVFVDDATRVLKEVGRVLAPGGTYLLSTMHPTTLRLYGSYKDGGWSPKITYFQDKPVPYTDEWGMTWTLGKKKLVAPTIEFGHRFETIVNGMAAAGMVVDGIWEFSPGDDDDETEPGSDAHLDTLFPAFIEVRARKLLPGALPAGRRRAPRRAAPTTGTSRPRGR